MHDAARRTAQRPSHQRYRVERPDLFPGPPEPQEYCLVLAETMPILGNELAHGQVVFGPGGLFELTIACDLINQLFEERS